MKLTDFKKLYASDVFVQSVLAELNENKIKRFHFQGLKGSAHALLGAAMYPLIQKSFLFIAQDKESAQYLANDLQNLITDKEVLIFPTSYKKPYQFEETDNANVLLRAEVLNRLNLRDSKGEVIVTYPEALTEKVISKKTLVENTMTARVGEQIDVNFITELLVSYEFEKTDFVYEPGQFAIRGGIVDIFSFGNELPYRLELFGNEIESIRTFDPNTQLSVDQKQAISIIPNVQNKLIMRQKESFLSFFAPDTLVWIDDFAMVKDVLKTNYEKVLVEYEKKKNVPQNLLEKPEESFETEAGFESQLSSFTIIEYGHKAYFKNTKTYPFQFKPQPPFKKDFNLLCKNFVENQAKGYTNYILSESHTQYEKLLSIFSEIDPSIKINHIGLSLKEGFVDDNLKIACYTDHQIFDRFYRYKSKERHSKSKAITLRELRSLQPGDYVTHADYGIAKFVGLEKIEVNGVQQEAIRLLFKDNDLMKVSILALHKIAKYAGKDGEVPTMSKLGTQDWENKKKAVKKKVKEIAIDLIKLYAKRKASPGFAFSPDNYLQAELETSFIYEDTPDQNKASEEVKQDMQKPHPMDRLVCGDVGFGKTEIAIRAAFKATCDSKQVAVLVPTTILAMQHYKTFKNRLEKFPVKVEYISRFRTPSQVAQTLKNVAEGKTDILIGTHKLIGKNVKFKDLGLLIIDEEQKFGVAVKEKLKEMKVNVDTLTLTATPIPRTLYFSLMGARDLSIISTPPPNRIPVTTEVHTFNEALIRDAVVNEIQRDGQVFIVHNRVSDLYTIADLVKRLVPESKVAVAHGQMEGDELENVMLKFIDGEYDVLVSTNIIESGLDIPNANTIIINNAHHFGLSDLHQMRGRVGRSNKKAFCYLLTPPISNLTSDAKKKLSAIEEFSDLGDGFKVAMRDLDIRGAGNLLGAEQTGFISDIGYELYHKLLDEAIQELKENEFRALFEVDSAKIVKQITPDCSIETDLAIIIPEDYVSNISERLSLYNELDNLKDENELALFVAKIEDRFGPMPNEVKDLIKTVRLRWVAEKLMFEKLSLKGKILKCQVNATIDASYFNGPSFGKILDYVKANPKKSSIKEQKDKLQITLEGVNTIETAITLLEGFLG